MSAHDPKASMIGATSVSTPMVRNPNERRVNIAAAGLAQIEAIMATGKGFDEAYAEAWRREVKPRQAIQKPSIQIAAPKPPRVTEVCPIDEERRKQQALKILTQTGEQFFAVLRSMTKFGKPVYLRVIQSLIAEGRVISRQYGRFTMLRLSGTSPSIYQRADKPKPAPKPAVARVPKLPKPPRPQNPHLMPENIATIRNGILHTLYRTNTETTSASIQRACKIPYEVARKNLDNMVIDGILTMRQAGNQRAYSIAGVPTNQYVHNNGTGNAKKARTIDGVKYESLKEACQKLKVSKGVILRWSENGVSDDCTRTSPRTCNIDGVEYASLGEASRALGKAKSVIALWAKTGVSKPSKSLSPRAATASQAFDHARTRKNSQTPSGGAISQSGAQMGGL